MTVRDWLLVVGVAAGCLSLYAAAALAFPVAVLGFVACVVCLAVWRATEERTV